MSFGAKGSRDRLARGIDERNRRGRRFLLLLAVAGLAFAPQLFAEEEIFIRIEPAVEVVPANHLKFYLHFPSPMERGEVFRYLRLVEIDKDGNEIAEVPEPFREVELWDESFTRMTLWFHPGRQKPGVNLNVEIGPILEEGNRYRLEISEDWKTEGGVALRKPSFREFTAGPLDDKQPDPLEWKLGKSTAHLGKWQARIITDEILDPVSARKRIQIFVDGTETEFHAAGKELSFPFGEARNGRVNVSVDPHVEDLAGNSVSRPFNLDLDANPKFVEVTEPIQLSFELHTSFP